MFWERFYALCIQKGTKPNVVAREISISSGILTKWKTSDSLPNGETLNKIADYFHCSVDYLLDRETQNEKNALSAASGKEDDLDKELISRLVQLTPAEKEKVDAFVQGLLASR